MKARSLSLLLVLLLGGLLVGCSSASDSASSTSSAGSGQSRVKTAAGAEIPAAGAQDGAAQPADQPVAGANQPATASAVARLVRTAQVTLEVADLSSSADRVRATALGLGGIVSAETTTFPPGTVNGHGGAQPTGVHPQSVLTLRVPEPRLDLALSQVTAVGHELDRSTSSTDVTGTLADLNSRVATQTASVNRVRALMQQATSLKDVVLIESELAQRQSDLEALEARQRTLDDQADLATLTVTLRTPDTVAATSKRLQNAGFGSGLRGGWHALAATTVVVLTGIGAVLPFGLALGVIAIPSYLFHRRRLRRRALPAAAPTS